MRPRHATLTPQELEIMKLVWERDSATVRDVYEALLERRKIAYTTVMTMMKILETKGYLKKRRQDRAFVYSPVHPKSQVIGGRSGKDCAHDRGNEMTGGEAIEAHRRCQ